MMKEGASSSSSSSWSSSPPSSTFWKHDVFLSFHSGDCSCSVFARNLYGNLWEMGIRTFLGDETIRPDAAEEISESRNVIVIFSENYASSKFCLELLVQALDCVQGNDGLILSVFYHVDPSDVRCQTKSYKVAFDHHEGLFHRDQVKIWRSALAFASDLWGWVLDQSGVYEYKIMEEIIQHIFKVVVNSGPIYDVPEFTVGLEFRVKEVISLLKERTHNSDAGTVTMLGIWGIGGGGKTLLAKAVYNLIASQFEHLCFLHNFRGKSLRLQKDLLDQITGNDDIGFEDVESGTLMIKHRLRLKKVLLIVDDVDSLEQLKAVAGEHDWFGGGSIIIITTRDRQLLVSHGINRIYEVQGLNRVEARELLAWHAFRGEEAGPEYEGVISGALDYACGLPLALEVLGSRLGGRSSSEWEYYLRGYKFNGIHDVQYILGLSYDRLGSFEKKVFLDIACFYEGFKLEYATNMMESSRGFRPDSCINALVDKALLQIDHDNFLKMHGLIQDMARKIARLGPTQALFPDGPGHCSRLWSSEDIIRVLKHDMFYEEIENLEAIMLDCADVEEVHWNQEAFLKMENLELLIINNAKFFGAPKYLPSGLRMLHWVDYPSTTLPLFMLGNLRYLNLERSDELTELPDLSGASNLKQLSVSGCKNLMKIDSICGHHANLRELRARGCIKLISFLEDGINFPSLEILDLTGCSNFHKFPEILGKMQKMKTLALGGTAIETLLESIENLAGLECLYLYNCRRLSYLPMHSIRKLTELVRLEAGSCGIFNWFKDHEVLWTVNLSFWNISRLHLNNNNISDQILARILRWFPRLQVLELRDNDFTTVPSCIEECCHLKRLYLDGCKQLQEIRGIPRNIEVLSAINSTALTSVYSRDLFKQILQVPRNRKFILPGGWVPEWIHCYNRGSSVSLRVRNKFPAIAVYVVFDVKGRGSSCFEFEIRVLINGTNRFVLKKDVLDIECGHVYMFDDLRLQTQELGLKGKKFNHVQMSCSADYKNKSSSDAFSYVNYIGVYVYNFASCAHDIQFENPNRTLDDDDSFSIYSDDSRKDRLYYAEDFFEGSEAIEDSCNEEMGSKHRWHIWLCVIVSSFVLCHCVLHLLWLVHRSLGRFLSSVGYLDQ